MSLTNRAFILLGSNINPQSNIRKAIDHLNYNCKVQGISKIYESRPVKKSDVENYLNAVVEIETDFDPKSIKYDVLRKIESEMGRVRTSDKFAPRKIDLDLILYDDEIYDDGDIVLPDPEITTYAHVAKPLADLIPDKRHPICNKTYDDIARELVGSSELVTVNL